MRKGIFLLIGLLFLGGCGWLYQPATADKPERLFGGILYGCKKKGIIWLDDKSLLPKIRFVKPGTADDVGKTVKD